MKIKLLSEGAKVPKRAEKGSAGYDLYVPCDSIVWPGRNVIPLDIAIELDPGTEGQIRPRSGFSVKGIEGLYGPCDEGELKRFDADVIIGTLDESYRESVGVIIKSHETLPFMIKKGTRVAQMVISKYESGEFEITDTLSETDRKGGFESTGTH